MQLIHELEHCDIFVSKAANEVLRMYKLKLDFPETMRVLHDKTASSVPVGGFYHGVYHTVVIAPATSNTVAKCVWGISDTLATNVFAQAGKCRVPAIVFACDTAPELETMAPDGPGQGLSAQDRPGQYRTAEELRAHHRGRIARRAGVWRSETGKRHWRQRCEDGAMVLNAGNMPDRFVFVTGHLAQARLERLLVGLGETDFAWEIVDIGVKVAALMTEEIIMRRLKLAGWAGRVILPGRLSRRPRPARRRISASRSFAVRTRSPTCRPFSAAPASRRTFRRHDMRIFAEIVDAPMLSIDALLARAQALRAAGADVIDLGCLPETPFPLLGEAVRELKAQGLAVSVDSANLDELRIGARAGADYLLSLDENTLPLAFDYGATPVLIPSIPGDLDSLGRAIDAAERGRHRLHRRPGARPDPFRLRRSRSDASSKRGGAGRRSNC